MNTDFFWPGILALIFFYALFYFLGRVAARKRSLDSTDEVMLAGRSLPLWLAIFTMSTTWIGGGYLNGTAEYTYSFGLAWAQAPWGYAMSLIIGGLFFARKMRRHQYTTMLDPLAERYGKKMAAVLFIPALSGEIFWTAAILTALGTTFGTVLGINFTAAIIISGIIALAYTSAGGLWSVAVTDVVQLLFLMIGLWLAIPFALEHSGSFSTAWQTYGEKKGTLASIFPPWRGWEHPDWGNYYWQWWDYALLLMFGGIPWQVYFQRVLAARNENTAMWLSVFAGFVCMLAAVPAVMIGVIGDVVNWEAFGVDPAEDPALILPYVIRYLTEPWIAALALGAIAAAVMSSVDSSVLSSASMGAWNVYRPLLKPDISSRELANVQKGFIWLVGGLAILLALQVKSVYALWFLCSDFVYCILFPQLLTALFDPKANRYGAIAGLVVSFVLRFGGGEPVLGLPALIPYPMVDEAGVILFPFRTLAMVCGLVGIVVVSRIANRMKNEE